MFARQDVIALASRARRVSLFCRALYLIASMNTGRVTMVDSRRFVS
jgi:hypothetical protein